MVAEANSDSTHDFLTDPIELVVDEDAKGNAIVRANMTTLGAAVVPRWALVADGFKLELSRGEGGPRTRLTKLGSDDVDLAGAAPEQRDRLVRALQSVRQGLVVAPETPQALSDADRARLRALGYGTSESMTSQLDGSDPSSWVAPALPPSR